MFAWHACLGQITSFIYPCAGIADSLSIAGIIGVYLYHIDNGRKLLAVKQENSNKFVAFGLLHTLLVI